MNRQLILVRHSVPQIRADVPAREWGLSQDGRRRAERMAEDLMQVQPDVVATSSEPKARETAEILAGRFKLPVQVTADLHEHERTALPYLSRQDFEEVVREFFEKPDALVFGNETADQAHERFSRAVNSILSQHRNSKIAIVAHGTVISLFVARLTGQSGYKIWSALGLPCFIILDIQAKSLIAFENFPE